MNDRQLVEQKIKYFTFLANTTSRFVFLSATAHQEIPQDKRTQTSNQKQTAQCAHVF